MARLALPQSEGGQRGERERERERASGNAGRERKRATYDGARVQKRTIPGRGECKVAGWMFILLVLMSRLCPLTTPGGIRGPRD